MRVKPVIRAKNIKNTGMTNHENTTLKLTLPQILSKIKKELMENADTFCDGVR